MDATIYQNIIDANRLAIRFLVVSPGPPEAPLSGTLLQNEAVLAVGNLQYEALSYTWGNPDHKGPITINDRPCLIGGNLYTALRALRYQDKPRYLWVDAICINQSDIAEKNLHIPQMHLVYQQAARVVVWLGPVFEDSDVAFSHLDMLWEEESVDGFVKRAVSSGRATPSQVLNGTIWRPLATLFSTPWWSRMWVVQELYFSDPSETVAVCGNEARTWDRLLLAQLLIRTGNIHIVSPQMPFGLYTGLGRSSYTLLEMRSPETSSLWNALVRIARVRMATDPRDKIFALLNLFDREEWPFAPDYSVDAVEVYTRVTLHFMRKTNSLSILSQCAVYDTTEEERQIRADLRRSHLPGLPSWAPDWTLVKSTVPYYMPPDGPPTTIDPPTGSTAPYRLAGDRILVVRGVTEDTVVAIHSIEFGPIGNYSPFTLETHGGIAAFLRAVEALRATIKQAGDRIDTEWALLVGEENTMPTYSKADYESYRRMGSPKPNQAFFDLANNRTISRKVAATSRGRLALVPKSTELGDCVAFIVGSPSPVLLQPVERGGSGTPEHATHYRVVEDAYVQGCTMEGVLGRCPEAIREFRLQ
ncbi:heterokaryon incompatibility protein-domain-containing protein [Apodospora peruviana]|uniref:Heterokaryon incompatibility protein-domain-containing protein n=1 Tax=Apodospora peruviana TaxID=516989 RepID=A0AAE0M081_9PEZI|nr:heterokaryon incompatibility protein-domain-containing protein [Apodospora peruviana]